MLTTTEVYNLLEKAFLEQQKGKEEEYSLTGTEQLLGPEGIFDSLDMMLFLTLVDELLSKKMGKEVTILEDDIFSQPISPFSTMQSLASYITKRLHQQKK